MTSSGEKKGGGEDAIKRREINIRIDMRFSRPVKFGLCVPFWRHVNYIESSVLRMEAVCSSSSYITTPCRNTEIYNLKLHSSFTYSRCYLKKCSSIWGTGKPRHLSGYGETSYINQNETQEPLKPWTSSDPHTHEDSSPNWDAVKPETSSVISLTDHNHINNW
jgi:hypothetical protein